MVADSTTSITQHPNSISPTVSLAELLFGTTLLAFVLGMFRGLESSWGFVCFLIAVILSAFGYAKVCPGKIERQQLVFDAIWGILVPLAFAGLLGISGGSSFENTLAVGFIVFAALHLAAWLFWNGSRTQPATGYFAGVWFASLLIIAGCAAVMTPFAMVGAVFLIPGLQFALLPLLVSFVYWRRFREAFPKGQRVSDHYWLQFLLGGMLSFVIPVVLAILVRGI